MTDTIALEFQDTNGVWWQLFLPSLAFTPCFRGYDPNGPTPSLTAYPTDGLLSLFRGDDGKRARFVAADVARQSHPSTRAARI